MLTYLYLFAAVLTCVLAVPGILKKTNAGEPKKAPSVNEKLTSDAFDALNANDLDGAIRKAEQCIKSFRRPADRLQQELTDKKEPAPPVGKVSDEEKEKIFNRGPLNDVAACYFIQGEAYSKLADRAEGAARQDRLMKAKGAYEAAATYTYARTWDLGGWFWDPAETANDRLADMQPKRR